MPEYLSNEPDVPSYMNKFTDHVARMMLNEEMDSLGSCSSSEIGGSLTDAEAFNYFNAVKPEGDSNTFEELYDQAKATIAKQGGAEAHLTAQMEAKAVEEPTDTYEQDNLPGPVKKLGRGGLSRFCKFK